MSARLGLLSGVGALALVGMATAKPPELPAPPYVEGRESPLLAREFHMADKPATGFDSVVVPPNRTADPDVADTRSFEELVNGVVRFIQNRMKIRMGS